MHVVSWRRLGGCAALGAALGLVTLPASAQTSSTRTFQSLRATASQMTQMRGVVTVRLQWSATSQASRVAGGRTLSLLGQQRSGGRLRVERRPELGPNHLVVVSVDASGRELDWRLTQNPRLMRLEAADEQGHLVGQTVVLDEADLVVAVPDHPSLEAVRVYQPRWQGTDFALDLLGEVAVPR